MGKKKPLNPTVFRILTGLVRNSSRDDAGEIASELVKRAAQRGFKLDEPRALRMAREELIFWYGSPPNPKTEGSP